MLFCVVSWGWLLVEVEVLLRVVADRDTRFTARFGLD